MAEYEASGEEISVKVVLLGDSGVGKTSLALRYVQDEFQPFQEATIGASFLSRNVQTTSTVDDTERTVHLKIWDTAGQERYHSLTPLYFRGAGAAILVFDICRIHSFETLQRSVRELDEHGPPDLIMLVCGNKNDLDDHRSVSREDAVVFANSIDAFYCETSARENNRVNELFGELAQQAANNVASSDLSNTRLEGTVDLGERKKQVQCCGL